VLAWDQWLMASAAILLVGGSLLGKSSGAKPDGQLVIPSETLLRWTPLTLLFVVAGLAAFQSWEIPDTWVQYWSPASHDAYTDWFVTATGLQPSERFPISVSQTLTTGYLWQSLILIGFVYAATRVFANRHFSVVLLVGMSLIALLHGAAGIYQQLESPGVYLFGSERQGQPFGAFVNRNNSGAMLNLGLAGALGLLAMRLYHVSGLIQDEKKRHRGSSGRRRSSRSSASTGMAGMPGLAGMAASSVQPSRASRGGRSIQASRPVVVTKPPSAWYAGTSTTSTFLPSWAVTRRYLADKQLLLAFGAVVAATAAVVASGSRGAMVGTIAGVICCLAIAVPASKLGRSAFAALAVAMVVLTSLNELGVQATSIDRLAEIETNERLEDGRFNHWADAWDASLHHLPMGAGLGAYRFAYLPFQELGFENWCMNADGQWVEWWLEGGLPMTVVVLVGLIALVIALRRLFASDDIVDRGLATAGVYALAAIGVSQSFDFALTLTPIAVVALLLMAAIFARQNKPIARRKSKRGSRVQSISQRKIPIHEKYDSELTWYERVLKLCGLQHGIPFLRQQESTRQEGNQPAETSSDGNRRSSRSESSKSRRDGDRHHGGGFAVWMTEFMNSRRPRQAGGLIRAVVAIAIMAGLAMVSERLSRRAASEALLVLTDVELNTGSINIDKMDDLDAMLAAQIEADPLYYGLMLKRAALQVQLFRFEEAVLLSQRKSLPLVEAFRRTNLRIVRRQAGISQAAVELQPPLNDRVRLVSFNGSAHAPGAGRLAMQSEDSTAGSSPEPFARSMQPTRISGNEPMPTHQLERLALARDLSVQVLRLCPLSDQARWNLVNLDFAVTSRENTPGRLRQIALLRERTPESLNEVSEAAIATNDWETARYAWTAQLKLGARFFRQVFAGIQRSDGEVRLSEVVPDTRYMTLLAAEHDLKLPRSRRDPEIEQRASKILRLPISEYERQLKRKLDED
jgi:hypothetical protein